MRLKVYSKNPAPKHIEQITDALKAGQVVILPTDSVYCFACDGSQPEAIAELARIKGLSEDKARFSYMFHQISGLNDYVRPLSNSVHKLMRRLLPGPFTFVLPASYNLKKSLPNRKELGVRIPNHQIPLKVIEALGHPLVTTSVYDEDEILEYTTDPEVIWERYQKQVAMVVDGGFGHNEASTVLDCTGNEVVILRKGIGALEEVA